ncbi:PDZ domain-containing protein [Humidesulfovibrio mexicanus]|uniref:PDZ domain-containing protein n=1 Tax=Humidesulfovibrio mexicanus TaxID=147047 RepID=A0A238Y6X4_9BACT|nr:M48 family metallopeptidase [Humidesulfovibrio mexicanus]SNR66578.1 PDZ domain-containing protein [Humidesulfovibrio mexicanus]
MSRSLMAAWLVCVAALWACAPQANVPRVDDLCADAEARTQQRLVLQDRVDKLDQLSRVAWNVRAKNAELCGNQVVYAVGLTFLELDDYKKEQRDMAAEVMGVAWRPTAFQIPPDSPAARAGLRRGDIVLSIAGRTPENKKQAREFLHEAIKGGREVSLEVERQGQRIAATLTPERLCDYPAILGNNAEVNAYADGDNIIVQMGMMRFVRSDDELAAIIGHEMAHNTGGHLIAMQRNAVLGRFLVDLPVAVLTGRNPNVGGTIGRQMYSVDFEFEADYVGLYYTARAGYDIRQVAPIWRRMALDCPQAITMDSSHPSTSKRFVALEAGAAEIEHKRTTGQPLRPEFKGNAQSNPPAKATPEEPPAATTIAIPAEQVE